MNQTATMVSGSSSSSGFSIIMIHSYISDMFMIGGDSAEAIFILAEFLLLSCSNCSQLERSPPFPSFL